jgi:4-oxalocrotonate tautomerase
MPSNLKMRREAMPVVTIQLLSGRSKEQKTKIAKAVTDAIVDIAGARPEGVQVIFADIEKADWANAGVLMSDK